MISIIIPTRNRGYTLNQVLKTYYIQKHVNEIIVVDDMSNDNTTAVIQEFASKHPNIKTIYIKNDRQRGASFSRNLGVSHAKNTYILFGEDDAFLEENYTEALLQILQNDKQKIGIASGRLISLNPKEDPHQAITRFGNGNPKISTPFDLISFAHKDNAYFKGEISLPLSHALILTKKQHLEKHPYDTYYSKGNGYREESDFQANLFVQGFDIKMTNHTHCMHLHPLDVNTGGHRTSHLKKFFYSVYYTYYFYNKHFSGYQKRLKIPYDKNVAIILFTLALSKEFSFALLYGIQKRFNQKIKIHLTKKQKAGN